MTTQTETRGRDFADWLSPMLVKELRQGMRSRVFVAAFYLTQVLMIMSVAFNLAASLSDDMPGELGSFLNGVFWFLIALPLLFLMPVRGFSALHTELKSGTLELVFLTHLSAWRIAAGKWTALMVQTLLVVCAILPYVLLRYFLGGVDILEDLQRLFFLLMTSAVLTAVTVAMSPYESKLLRALFVIGMIFAVQFLAGILLTWLTVGRMMGGGGSVFQSFLGIAIFVPASVVLALEFAASKIAPAAENHAIRKRLLALAVFFTGAGLLVFGESWIWGYWMAVAFLAPVIVDALGEPLQVVRTVYQPFLQRGSAGRIFGLFFTPGWPSGVWFTLLVTLLCGVVLVFSGKADDSSMTLAAVAFFGALIFPATFIRLLMPKTKNFLGFYIGLQFFFAVVTVMVGIMSAISSNPFTTFLAWIPNCAFLLISSDQIKGDEAGIFAVVSVLATVVSFVILLILTTRPLRDIRAALAKDSPTDVHL
jgi:hypothetical protein